MAAIQYDGIAQVNYTAFLAGELNNNALRHYFDGCFQQAIENAGCYPAWACIACLQEGQSTAKFGNQPARCPVCASDKVFAIATFQSRAPVVGNAFESAVRHLLTTRFELPAAPTPGNTITHDIEVTPKVAIETKGSPRRLQNPDKTITNIARPGLERSDTWKKAQANARNFRRQNRDTPFYIVSNAVPAQLVGYRSDDISGIFNIVQANRLNSLVEEIRAAI